MMKTEKNRKIVLPPDFHPMTGHSFGGDSACDHNYPPESRRDEPGHAEWTCSKCGMIRRYEVYD